MSGLADLMQGVAALLWVLVALAALWILRGVLSAKDNRISRFALGPTGVTMEFAEAKLSEAVSNADQNVQGAVGQASRRSVIDRLQRHADLLSRARILWVDDHPENNAPIVELLRKYGTVVETPRSNDAALALLRASRYGVVISDVGRDQEGPAGALAGIALARTVFDSWGQRTLLFTARFDPARVPGVSDTERLQLVVQARETVFAITNRTDEVLHYILDLLERS